jgi:Phosphopantetheine attachment site
MSSDDSGSIAGSPSAQDQVPAGTASLPDCPAKPATAAGRAYVAPRGEVEAGVAEILARLLEVERVGAQDNFILLGGESLRAAQAARQIWDRFGKEVSLRSILTGKVGDIAREISAPSPPPEAE